MNEPDRIRPEILERWLGYPRGRNVGHGAPRTKFDWYLVGLGLALSRAAVELLAFADWRVFVLAVVCVTIGTVLAGRAIEARISGRPPCSASRRQRVPPLYADVHGLYVGRLRRRFVAWWRIRRIDPSASIWKLETDAGTVAFDPSLPGNDAIRRTLTEVLNARAAGYLLPDEPDPRLEAVPDTALSRLAEDDGPEAIDRGLSLSDG